MEYYIYTNWQAQDKEKNLIHRWNCGDCRMGFGKHKNAEKGKNGVWIGSFENIKLAKLFAIQFLNDKKIDCCKKCTK